MEKIGVMAVVEGLSSFLGDMDKMDNKIRSLVPGNSLLERAFVSLGDVVSGFATSALRTLEYAIGGLLTDAIEAAVGALGELIQRTLDAGNELQTLEIRLNGLNLPSSAGDITDWSAAMADASKKTEDQLNWIQQLAVAAPFSIQDIADVYTMARAMGYGDDAARSLTTDIFEFVAGMGQAADVADHIILNLFQMETRGKVTGREMSDLARGSLVPLADILQRMADNMGISVEELNKMISSAEGVDPDLFIKAFQEMVNEEPRFIGAMGRLGRSFQAATMNFSQLIESLGAKNVVVPILDILGERIASITDQFINFNAQGDMVKTDKWYALVDAATRVGTAITDIISALLGLAPSAESIADGMVTSLDKVATWLTDNKDGIVTWVQNAVAWFGDVLIPKLQEVWKWLFGDKEEGSKGAIAGFFTLLETTGPGIITLIDWIVAQVTKFSDWVTNNRPLIDEFFATLGEIVSTVLEDLFGKTPGEGEGFLGVLKTIMQWVIDNKEGIANFIEGFIKLSVAWDILKFVGGVLLGILAPIAVLFTTISIVVGAVGIGVGLLIVAILGAIAAFVLWGDEIKNWADTSNAKLATWQTETKAKIFTWADETGAKIKEWVHGGEIETWADETGTKIAQWVDETGGKIKQWIFDTWNSIKQWAFDTTNEIKSAFDPAKWVSIGSDMIGGVITGILTKGSELISTVAQLAVDAYNSITSALGINSPSKLFMEVGYKIDEGLAAGIMGMAKDVGNAMGSVMGQVTAPAFNSASAPSQSISNNQQYTRNYNLNINSNANSENLSADFEMLQGLAG